MGRPLPAFMQVDLEGKGALPLVGLPDHGTVLYLQWKANFKAACRARLHLVPSLLATGGLASMIALCFAPSNLALSELTLRGPSNAILYYQGGLPMEGAFIVEVLVPNKQDLVFGCVPAKQRDQELKWIWPPLPMFSDPKQRLWNGIWTAALTQWFEERVNASENGLLVHAHTMHQWDNEFNQKKYVCNEWD
jgi:hypothetical protein